MTLTRTTGWIENKPPETAGMRPTRVIKASGKTSGLAPRMRASKKGPSIVVLYSIPNRKRGGVCEESNYPSTGPTEN
jgi:hypothetical protein